MACRWVSPASAFAGAAIFAVHPLHMEAVANVVGLSELGAAAECLLAVLLYPGLQGATSSPSRLALVLGVALS